MQFIKALGLEQNEEFDQNADPEGRLIDLEKAYPGYRNRPFGSF